MARGISVKFSLGMFHKLQEKKKKFDFIDFCLS